MWLYCQVVYDVENERKVGPLDECLPAHRDIAGADTTLGDFWRWAYSDVLSNAMRGCLGEFLVASQLEITDVPRVEWDAVDLRLPHHGEQYGIEVKTSSRFQSWPLAEGQQRSEPTFGFSERRPFNFAMGKMELVARRCADVYVFCHYRGPHGGVTDNVARRLAVLDVDRWEFFIASTTELEAAYQNRRMISLAAIKDLTKGGKARRCSYSEIKPAVMSLLHPPSRLTMPLDSLQEIPETGPSVL